MKKSLKVKFLSLFLILIFVNILLDGTSIYNLFEIGKSSNVLLNDNYDSITACDKMTDIIELMNEDIIDYITSNDGKFISDFYKQNSDFHAPYYFQLNNITEDSESVSTLEIKNNYESFMSSFSNLIANKTSLTDNSTYLFKQYANDVQPKFIVLRDSIRKVALLNQKAMLKKKDSMVSKINTSTNYMTMLSVGLIILSFVLALRAIIKFLEPIYALQKDILKAKEGDFSHKAKILSDDEIGLLASEFNDMSNKICEFQNSTLGQLLDEKNKSLAIVKSISAPLIVLDINCRILLLNDACEDFFHIHQDEMIGHHILEAIPNGDLYDFISELINGSLDRDNKIMNFKKNKFTYNVNLSIIRDNMSNLNGIIVNFQNITDITNLEKMKTNFVSSLSHEIKTPLTSIIMGASLLEEVNELNKNKTVENIISTINEDSQKLLSLINNFLRISQITSDESLLNKEIFDMNNLIQCCVTEFSNIANSKAISIIFNSTLTDAKYYGDEEKIGWVINNLLSNGIKFSNENSKIYVNLRAIQSSIEITITDEGIGISDENLPKLFSKFFRANENISGTGLGLSLSKQILDIHNGLISCESKLDIGTTFKVILHRSI